MTSELQEETAATLCAALEAIKAAIQDAWSDTRAQVEDYQFPPLVLHTAFAQFLVHNVRNRITRVETPGLVSQLVANRMRSAYHVKGIIENEVFLTVSSVPDPQSTPRHARFRADYTHGFQSWFTVTDQDEFEPVPPVKPTATYIQILHGPRGQSGQQRQELGFIQVAFPNGDGESSRPAIPLDAYIAGSSAEPSARVEVVREEGNLGVTLKEGSYARK